MHRGLAGEALLDSYCAERRPVGQANADLSVRNFQETLRVARALGLDPGLAGSAARAAGLVDRALPGVGRGAFSAALTLGRLPLSRWSPLRPGRGSDASPPGPRCGLGLPVPPRAGGDGARRGGQRGGRRRRPALEGARTGPPRRRLRAERRGGLSPAALPARAPRAAGSGGPGGGCNPPGVFAGPRARGPPRAPGAHGRLVGLCAVAWGGGGAGGAGPVPRRSARWIISPLAFFTRLLQTPARRRLRRVLCSAPLVSSAGSRC